MKIYCDAPCTHNPDGWCIYPGTLRLTYNNDNHYYPRDCVVCSQYTHNPNCGAALKRRLKQIEADLGVVTKQLFDYEMHAELADKFVPFLKEEKERLAQELSETKNKIKELLEEEKHGEQ